VDKDTVYPWETSTCQTGLIYSQLVTAQLTVISLVQQQSERELFVLRQVSFTKI